MLLPFSPPLLVRNSGYNWEAWLSSHICMNRQGWAATPALPDSEAGVLILSPGGAASPLLALSLWALLPGLRLLAFFRLETPVWFPACPAPSERVSEPQEGWVEKFVSSLLLLSGSVLSDSLRPHGLQHARLHVLHSQGLCKLMSIESVMPSNHFILCLVSSLITTYYFHYSDRSISVNIHCDWIFENGVAFKSD